MAKSASSKRWLRRHVTDRRVHDAAAQGYRSRAAFKLLEIDRKDRLLRPGMRVLDIGAAPGGWSQVAAERVRPGGRVVAVDLLALESLSGVTAIRGDVRDASLRAAVVEALGGAADLVLCDLSPNLSGIASADQARAAELVEFGAAFAVEVLQPDGAFLCKIFHGEAFSALLQMLKRAFVSVQVRKPSASRSESRETYVLARGPRRA
jgi:23S rRNA (uridine2552-2'-O)-methyltransferase